MTGSTIADQDIAYGFTRDGPCQLHDLSWTDHWLSEGIATSVIETVVPSTRVLTVVGSSDKGPAPAQGKAVTDLPTAAASPMIVVQTIAGMGHSPNRAGFAALRVALPV